MTATVWGLAVVLYALAWALLVKVTARVLRWWLVAADTDVKIAIFYFSLLWIFWPVTAPVVLVVGAVVTSLGYLLRGTT